MKAAFEIYVGTQLVPTLSTGDAVILDNLAAQTNEKGAKVLLQHGAWFMFLSPYSPDMKPIEMTFSKLRSHLRRIGARTFNELWKAIGQICDLFDPEKCWNFFKQAGHVTQIKANPL